MIGPHLFLRRRILGQPCTAEAIPTGSSGARVAGIRNSRAEQSVINRKRYRDYGSRSWRPSVCLLIVLLVVRSASAQDTTSSGVPDQPVQSAPAPPPGGRVTFRAAGRELSAGWLPLGLAPVDQAGAGGRGYVLAMEDTDVTAAGANQFSIHAVAANNFYREQNSDFLVTQRYETHTLALDYRRGFKMRGVPRFEIGGQVQLHESDNGVLNGFIQAIESFWFSLTGYESSKNELRTRDALRPPQGTVIARNGSPIYREFGTGSGIGDVHVTAKAALLDGDPSSTATRLSARIGINVAGSAQFSAGNFVGAGFSLDKKLLSGLAVHGDVRATRALDHMSVWNLPLRRWAYGFSAGPELKLPKNSSFNLQIGGSSTPYMPTGTLAFDKGYGDITFGLGHRFKTGSGHVTAQLYLRENMNLPFTVRWNTDPDLSVGLRVRIH